MTPIAALKECQALKKVVLVDDHVSLRDMLRVILRVEGLYDVVGEASGGLDAMRVCRATHPDIVILDLALPSLSGPHLVHLLMREKWDVRVVVYSGTMDEGLMRDALKEKPHGFVRKEDPLPELRTALKVAAAGGHHVSPWAKKLLPSKSTDNENVLNASERAMLHMIAEGMQMKEIAEALDVTVKSAEHYRQNLRDKLGLHDIAALIRYAMQHSAGRH